MTDSDRLDPRYRYEIPPPGVAEEERSWLPTFFIVGAPKAGTTSLHNYLGAHPEIAVSTNKEPMCFAHPDWLERISRYRELFEGSAPLRGESSTAYSSFPWAPEVPDRIHATVPDARIVYLVRDPVARALSHYAQNVWDDLAWAPFERVLEELEHPLNMPVWCSRYATQVERWIARFGRDRVLIIDHRSLREDRVPTIRRVLEFLGVDRDFSSPHWDAEHNIAEEHRLPTRLGQRVGGAEGRVLQRPLLRRALTRRVPTPTLTERQRARLERILAPEADRLRELTGQRFDDWSV